ncbi:MAG TPA: ribosome assembly RNA-binding protein YhbY [Firmicutes bacterium]|jgi:RNA-binding protein|nr:ribosome assembly RNA-binding protein YhbY [Bacillota bacterium]
MVTPKQKAFLKSKAQKVDCKFQIGKNEITPELLDMLNKALVAHELIKVHVLKNATTPLKELALDLAGALRAEIIQTIGKQIVLYKPNLRERKIILPE